MSISEYFGVSAITSEISVRLSGYYGQHADSSVGGFGVAQSWPKTQTTEVAFVDLGIGIRRSLTANADYADITDDRTAIERALQAKVSATPKRNGGIGLYITRRLLEANGGFFFARSGFGHVRVGGEQRNATESPEMPGTLIASQIRTDRPLDIRPIYEQLERDYPTDHDL